MSNVLKVSEVQLEGLHLVEAAAGTGKTYNITAFYVRLIIEKGLRVDQILVVTYTRSATRELRERIDERMRLTRDALKGKVSIEECDDFIQSIYYKYRGDELVIERLNRAIDDLDLAAIHTIHGFCRQTLQEQVFESGSLFDVEFITDETDLQAEVHDDLWLEFINWAEAEPVRAPAFRLLVDEIKEPDGLAGYTSKVKGKPFVQLYEDQLREPDEICREYHELWQGLRGAWDPEGMQRLLSDKTLITQRSFNRSRTPKWIAGMQEMLNLEHPPPDPSAVFDNFSKFTVDHIEKYRTNNALPEDLGDLYRFFELCQRMHELSKSGELKQVLLNLVVSRFRQLYEHAKQQKKVRTYDDLLIALNEALNQQNLVQILQKNFPAALIDEFQDTDPVQFRIFDKIYMQKQGQSDLSLFLIGDPKQSIYSFRGADIFTYIEAKNKVTYHWTLDKNYRSACSLVGAINYLFSHKDKTPFLLDDIEFHPIDVHKGDDEMEITGGIQKEPMQFLLRPEKESINKDQAVRRVAQDTASEIRRLLDQPEQIRIEDAPIEAKDIAVLVGRHHEGAKIKEELAKRGIRSVDQSKASVYRSPEADYIMMLLYALRDPSNPSLIRALLGSRISGFTFSELQALRDREDQWLAILDYIRELNELFKRNGFLSLLRKFLSTPIKQADQTPATPLEVIMYYSGGERTLTNLMHLGEELNDYARSGNRGLEDMIKWMIRKREDAAGEEEELRLESDRELVKIITMHSAKGLQFPVVFCPYLWVGTDPKNVQPPFVFQEQNQRIVDFAGRHERASTLVLQESVSEHLRLAYVALTRARYRCYVGWAPYEKQEFAPLTGLMLGSDYMRQFIEDPDSASSGDLSTVIEKLAESEFIGITEPQYIGNESEEPEWEADHIGEAREWKRGEVHPSWFITSYSGMKQGRQTEPEGPFADEGIWDEEQAVSAEPISEKKNIFIFPRGAKPGMFLHQVFEEITFSDSADDIKSEIRRLLEEYQFEPDWLPVIYSMTHRALTTPVLPENKQWHLSELNANQYLREMEFHFRITDAEFDEVEKIISGNSVSKPNGSGVYGFMKGYIDLIFEHEGMYYILDYKSDYLGDNTEDYRRDALEAHMRERGYHLQYHIYTVALIRYLKTRMPEFDYNKHFGGAIYLYLRGMQNGNGIYFDRPDAGIIQKLDSYFDSTPERISS